MHIAVIPSWYPTDTTPLAGVFIREQAQAIAQLSPTTQVSVSTWGHNECGLSACSFTQSYVSLQSFLRNRRRPRCRLVKGVREYLAPTLTWPRCLPGGGLRPIVESNLANLRLAQEQLGPVDLIHAHVCYPAGYIARVLAPQLGVPYIITEHMSPFPFPSLLSCGRLLPDVAGAIHEAAAVVAVSPSLADAIASYGFERPAVIPNLVDERRFEPAPATRTGTVFFTLCGMAAQKGVDHLLRAIAQWDPPAGDAEFWIAGDGPQRATYMELAKRLEIDDRIVWLGPVSREDAPRFFRECNAFVLPSRHETFGIVFAEALACGKPVLATRCGGPECIINEVNGRLVEVGDIPGLARELRAMAKAHATYSSSAIRSDFMARFSRHAVVPQILALYEKVLANSSTSRAHRP